MSSWKPNCGTSSLRRERPQHGLATQTCQPDSVTDFYHNKISINAFSLLFWPRLVTVVQLHLCSQWSWWHPSPDEGSFPQAASASGTQPPSPARREVRSPHFINKAMNNAGARSSASERDCSYPSSATASNFCAVVSMSSVWSGNNHQP